MRPVIGVVPLFDVGRNSLWMIPGYMDGIVAAGGLPLILPLTSAGELAAQALSRCQGILITGGQDVDPALYGQDKAEKCGESLPVLDDECLAVIDYAMARDMPCLGICRGIQILNAALGGTLYQDLPSEHPSELIHCQKPPYDRPAHTVTIGKDSALFAVAGQEILPVNSYHHQAVKVLAAGLESMAVTPDGLCEAVKVRGRRFIWAVQWHPELNFRTEPSSLRLFKRLVSEAEAYGNPV